MLLTAQKQGLHAWILLTDLQRVETRSTCRDTDLETGAILSTTPQFFNGC